MELMEPIPFILADGLGDAIETIAFLVMVLLAGLGHVLKKRSEQAGDPTGTPEVEEPDPRPDPMPRPTVPGRGTRQAGELRRGIPAETGRPPAVPAARRAHPPPQPRPALQPRPPVVVRRASAEDSARKIAVQATQAAQVARDSEQRRAAAATPEPAPRPAVVPASGSAALSKPLSRARLREAIVLNEIIQPPLALRPQGSDSVGALGQM